jgi:hypothetical protein
MKLGRNKTKKQQEQGHESKRVTIGEVEGKVQKE